MSTRIVRALDERDLFRDRLLGLGVWGERGEFGGRVGASSNALLEWATGGPWRGPYPADEGDVWRCEQLVEHAPAHLREVLQAGLDCIRQHRPPEVPR